MANISVAVMNVGEMLTGEGVDAGVPALQIQVYRDLVPIWRIDADLVFVRDASPAAGAWRLAVVDTSDQLFAPGSADAIGAGLPSGKVFVGTDEKFGLSWTIAASGELLEMLADPEFDLTVVIQPGATTGMLSPSDAGGQLASAIGGAALSSLIRPGYRENAPPSTGGKGPTLSLLQGGYAEGDDEDWHHFGADDRRSGAGRHARMAGRREPRRLSPSTWRRSKPDFR